MEPGLGKDLCVRVVAFPPGFAPEPTPLSIPHIHRRPLYFPCIHSGESACSYTLPIKNRVALHLATATRRLSQLPSLSTIDSERDGGPPSTISGRLVTKNRTVWMGECECVGECAVGSVDGCMRECVSMHTVYISS
jgi:hypothetical protein